MASNVSVIGRTTRVRGRVTGAVDIEIQGFVEGDVTVGGDVTVDSTGIVGAGVRGRRVVVRGAVKGDLVGEESIRLEQGARVVGDLSAPRIAIATGALVRGHVQTGNGESAPVRATRQQPAARPAPAVPAIAASMPKPIAAVAPAAAPKAAIAARPAASLSNNTHANASSSARRPPPPVVPALRSSKGQIAKKKER
jgi:cytoskeletal protein CcmA (bactofilin family)